MIFTEFYEFSNIDSKSGEQISLLFTGPRLIRSPVCDAVSIFTAKRS